MNVSFHDCRLDVTPLKAGVEAHSLFFGEFELCPHRLLLLKGSRTVSLNHRALHLLVALARRPFELIEKDELTACAWPARVMEESSLRAQIAALRRALGASVDCPYVETVPGRGYRFVAAVAAQRQRIPALLTSATGMTFASEDTLETIANILVKAGFLIVLDK